MQVSRCKSRVVINDSIFDKIQQQRYLNHIKTLQTLKIQHSNSEYLINKNNIVQKLDRYKKNQKEIKLKLFPNDIEYKNCQRRVREISNSHFILPKINHIPRQNNRIKKDIVAKIDKENKILLSKFDHLELQKKNKKNQLKKSIQHYQSYKKLSRRFRQLSLDKSPLKQ